MAQKKLIRFSELETFSNTFQFPVKMAGTWNGFFKNNNPVVLELACGKGEYTIGLAQMYPNKNFIGVDIKGNRLWVGAKKAIQHHLNNVAFLRIQIDSIPEYFATEEVDEIWITFPDPQIRISKSKKRLTHPKFLRLYYQILKPNGKIHLKTDSPDLYRFTKKVIDMYGCQLHKNIADVYAEPGISPELRIKTHYETLDIAQSNRVHYLCFSLPEVLPSKKMDMALQEFLKILHPHLSGKGEGFANSPSLFLQDANNNSVSLESGSVQYGEVPLPEEFREDLFAPLTAEYLLERGYCCGNGCKNCPYNYKAVPEPKRSQLLTQRKKDESK